jgi:hypothetical protein
MLIALNRPAGSARAEPIAPAATSRSSSPAASLEERVELLERAIVHEQPRSSLNERVLQLERRAGSYERSLSKESAPVAIDAEKVRRSVEALERSTRAIETRLASLERAQRGNTLDRASQDLLELESTVDRIIARVDELDLRVRRLERATEW